MTKDNLSTGIEFEILKLVFFIVTYFLITDGLDDSQVSSVMMIRNCSSFYNTLFIFSASTWVDYLSAMRIYKRKRYYDGKYEANPYIPLFGSIVGIITVSISMYCVCKKGMEFFDVAVAIYYISLIYIFLKAFVITDMILNRIEK